MPERIVTKNTEWIDYREEVLRQMNANKSVSLNAMGLKAVELIVRQMQSGYGKPIRQTGDLMRDVNYEVEASGENTVDVGNSLEYATFVHDGTRKMAARPYIKDALLGGEDKISEIAQKYLKQGF